MFSEKLIKLGKQENSIFAQNGHADGCRSDQNYVQAQNKILVQYMAQLNTK